jgi:hypothetical protein
MDGQAISPVIKVKEGSVIQSLTSRVRAVTDKLMEASNSVNRLNGVTFGNEIARGLDDKPDRPDDGSQLSDMLDAIKSLESQVEYVFNQIRETNERFQV